MTAPDPMETALREWLTKCEVHEFIDCVDPNKPIQHGWFVGEDSVPAFAAHLKAAGFVRVEETERVGPQ